MLFLLTYQILCISEQYQSLANKALQYAKRSPLDIDSKEDSLAPGVHNLKEGYIHLAHTLTSSTTKDVRGYAIDGTTLAIAPSSKRSIKNFDFEESTVFVDTENQLLYRLKRRIEEDQNVIIFDTEKVDPLTVFPQFHFTISTREIQFDGPTVTVEGDSKRKIKGGLSYSHNWTYEEGQDKYFDGRPKTKPIFDGIPLECGVGGIIGLDVEATIDYSVLKEFFVDAKFTFGAAAGALIKYASENTIEDDEDEEESGKLEFFDQKYWFNNAFGFSFCGYDFGLFPGIHINIGLEDIKFKIGEDLSFYRGVYLKISKGITIFKNGFHQSNWEYEYQKISENLDFKKVTDVKFWKNLNMTLTPYLKCGGVIALIVGKDEIMSLELYVKPKLPVSLAFNDNKCGFPYIYGGISFGFDVGIEFSGFKISKFTIIPEWSYNYELFRAPEFNSCLLGTTKGLSGPGSFSSNEVNEGKLIQVKSDEIEFTPQSDSLYSYCYEEGSPLYMKFTDPIKYSKGKKEKIHVVKTENSAFIGRVIQLNSKDPTSSVKTSEEIPVDNSFVIFRYEIETSKKENFNPNMIFLLRFENYVPIADKFDEFVKYYFAISLTDKMITFENNKAIIQIAMRRRHGNKTACEVIAFPIIFQLDTASLLIVEDMYFDAYPSTIAFPGGFKDHNDYDIDTISESELSFRSKLIEIFTSYFIYLAIPETIPPNKYHVYHYRSSYKLTGKEFPVLINTSTPMLWKKYGITGKSLTITCDYCDHLAILSSSFEVIPGNKPNFTYSSTQEHVIVYPICSNQSKAFCAFYMRLDRSSNNLLRFPHTDGLRHLVRKSVLDFDSLGFYSRVYKAGYDSDPRWVWKTWEGKLKVAKQISYYNSASDSITVKKIWYPTKGVGVRFYFEGQQIPVCTKDTQALIYLFNNIGCTNFGNIITDPNKYFFDTDGSIRFASQNTCTHGEPTTYNPSYIKDSIGLSLRYIPENIDWEDAYEPDPPDPVPPRQHAPPARTPMRTPLKYPDDQDFSNGDDKSGKGSELGEDGSSSGITTKIAVIVGIIFVLIIIVGVWCWLRKCKKNQENDNNQEEDNDAIGEKV